MIFAKIRFFLGGFVILFNTAILMIPAMFFFRRYASQIIHHINRLTFWMLGGKIVSHGIMDKNADLYLMNHQGVVDIIGFEAFQNNRLRWVAKKELFELFWIGKVLNLAQMIPLDRNSKIGIRKLIKEFKHSKDTLHRPVAMFPEGTRCDTQVLRPFKSGASIIADSLKLKVQPVVITGSKYIFDEKSKTAHSGTLHFHFLPTIDRSQNEDTQWYKKLQQEMQKVIDDQLHNNHCSR